MAFHRLQVGSLLLHLGEGDGSNAMRASVMPLLILLLTIGGQGDVTVPVHSDKILAKIFVQTAPSPQSLERLLANERDEILSRHIVRFAVYASRDDLELTEAEKTTDVQEEGWRERFSEERRLAGPAAEFVKVGSRASLRYFDGRTATAEHLSGYRGIDEKLCPGCDLRFLHLGVRMVRSLQSGVTPYVNLDLFFLYKGGFTERDARIAVKELGLQSFRHVNLVFTSDPLSMLANDYPYFNRFIDPKLYTNPSSGAVEKLVKCWNGAGPKLECSTEVFPSGQLGGNSGQLGTDHPITILRIMLGHRLK